MVNIYVLELEGGNYYVGKTSEHSTDLINIERVLVLGGQNFIQ